SCPAAAVARDRRLIEKRLQFPDAPALSAGEVSHRELRTLRSCQRSPSLRTPMVAIRGGAREVRQAGNDNTIEIVGDLLSTVCCRTQSRGLMSKTNKKAREFPRTFSLSMGRWISNPSRPCRRPALPERQTLSSAVRRPWLPW